MAAGASARKLARVTVVGGGAAFTGRRRCLVRVVGSGWTFTRTGPGSRGRCSALARIAPRPAPGWTLLAAPGNGRIRGTDTIAN